jgi:hypothetical protein
MSWVVQNPGSCQRIINSNKKQTYRNSSVSISGSTKIIQPLRQECDITHFNSRCTDSDYRKYSFISWLRADNITAAQQQMPPPALQCSVQQQKISSVADALTNQKPTHTKQFCFSIIPVNRLKQAYTANCNFVAPSTVLRRYCLCQNATCQIPFQWVYQKPTGIHSLDSCVNIRILQLPIKGRLLIQSQINK